MSGKHGSKIPSAHTIVPTGIEQAINNIVKSPPCKLFAGRYRLGEKLGAGGMGTVYLAEDTRLNRKVALKQIQRKDDASSVLLKEEAKTLAQLKKHPNIVAVYDVGDDVKDGCYLTMEYIEGDNLKQWIKKNGQMEPTKAVALFQKIANALQTVHA